MADLINTAWYTAFHSVKVKTHYLTSISISIPRPRAWVILGGMIWNKSAMNASAGIYVDSKTECRLFLTSVAGLYAGLHTISGQISHIFGIIGTSTRNHILGKISANQVVLSPQPRGVMTDMSNTPYDVKPSLLASIQHIIQVILESTPS